MKMLTALDVSYLEVAATAHDCDEESVSDNDVVVWERLVTQGRVEEVTIIGCGCVIYWITPQGREALRLWPLLKSLKGFL